MARSVQRMGLEKSLTASLDQSLRRMKLDYVDIFYHHRPDPETPMEETAEALSQIVKQGKPSISVSRIILRNRRKRWWGLLKGMGVHLLLHQLSHSMFERRNEPIYDLSAKAGFGTVAFAARTGAINRPVSERHPGGFAHTARAFFLTESSVTEEKMHKVVLHGIIMAYDRGQTLSRWHWPGFSSGRRP